jgi:LysM repeat protein
MVQWTLSRGVISMPDDREESGMRQAPQCPGGFLYQIRSGDTLYALAGRYGTTVEAITRANPGIDPNSLRVGQLICIPVAAAPPGPPAGACPAGSTPYVIRSGDTFYSIARRFNTTVAALTAANPRVNPNNLRVGQLVCIPTVPPPTAACPPGSTPYAIRSGDTFYRIAQRAGISVSALVAANPGVDPNRLRVGQVICIPGAPPPRRVSCTMNLLAPAGSPAPGATGRLWIDTNAAGNLQITVAGVDLPAPATLGANIYTAVFSADGVRFSVPMVATVEGRWTGTMVQPPSTALLTRGRVDIYPGPVLSGLLANCR